MRRRTIRERSSERTGRNRKLQPSLEGLEERFLLYATSGGQWAQTSRITYSIVPDGTDIAGSPSDLQATFNARFPTQDWLSQIERAAAVWEAVANINLALVPDDGSPIAVDGAQQGDPRFGDIRIGGISQSTTTLGLAFATPPYNGGALAGDIVFNTAQPFQINGSAYDLQSVAIHEIGHALGMSHSSIYSAAIYAYYTTTKQALTADDTSGVQSIYGVAPPDLFDSIASNQTQATATNLSTYIDVEGRMSMPHLRLSSASDLDYYKLVAPASTNGTLTVTVQTSNLSSMSPQVWLVNASNQILAKAAAPKSYGSTASVTIGGVVAGQTYYVRVVGADTGPSGQGGYGLLANFGASPLAPIAPDSTYVPEQPDQPGGPGRSGQGTPLQWLLDLLPVKPKFLSRFFDLDEVLGTSIITLGNITAFGDRYEVDPGPAQLPGASDKSITLDLEAIAPKSRSAFSFGDELTVTSQTVANPPAASNRAGRRALLGASASRPSRLPTLPARPGLHMLQRNRMRNQG